MDIGGARGLRTRGGYISPHPSNVGSRFGFVVAVYCIRDLERASERPQAKGGDGRNYRDVDLCLPPYGAGLGPFVHCDFSAPAEHV